MFVFKLIKKIIFIGLILWCFSCSSQEDKPQPAIEPQPPTSSLMRSVLSNYSDFVEKKIKEKKTPVGMAIGIVKDGRILLENGYGLRSSEKRDSVNAKTVFRIASLSKGFASGLAATFVRDGLISWQTKVKKILPDLELFEDSTEQLLELQHLLSHTSGLPRHTYGNLIEADVPLEKMIKHLKDVKPIALPGELLAYQNVIFSVVDPILSKIKNNTYAELMKQRIYKPLQMENASTDFKSILDHPNFASPHKRNGQRMRLDSAYFSVLPAAGVNASIADMNQWLLAMLGYYPNEFPEKTLEELTGRRIILPKNNPWSRTWDGIEGVGYGLGWRIVDYKGLELVYHGGYVNGYRAEIAFCKKEDVGIVLLSNSFTPFFHQSVPSFFDIYLEQKKMENEDVKF